MSPASRTDWRPGAALDVLKKRARMLQNIRAFFTARHVLEVETPILSSKAVTDIHLHSFQTRFHQQPYYLHTSPEFFMKRLLAADSGDIYQICKVFRDDEQGRNHNPEFSMLEWYRLGIDHHQLMEEIEQLFNSLMVYPDIVVPSKVAIKTRYQQAFMHALAVDPLSASTEELKHTAMAHNIDIPQGMADDRDMWLDWLMVAAVAPTFARDQFTFVYDYPASQAALACINAEDPRTAHRFEVYYGEIELGNGFYELTDAIEQRKRFEADNAKRQQLNLPEMPIDEYLLAALKSGMPACSGVAVGLDRLLMILLGKQSLEEVLAFGWNRV
ncbi:MAG: EF-P lysine aminoacylase GenX [Gammaproteobacteria bacterium]|nr:MAG: EF-P lysine aminoacylase GenX [Gammaproteobacteria bacterium]